MFGEIFSFLVDLFVPDGSSQEQTPAYKADFKAYSDAWDEREQTGVESESLLKAELKRSGTYISESDYPELLFDAWRLGLTPKYAGELMRGK